MSSYDYSTATMEEVDAAYADLCTRRLAAQEDFKDEAAALKARRDEIESEDGYVVPTILADGTVVTEPGPPELAQGVG